MCFMRNIELRYQALMQEIRFHFSNSGGGFSVTVSQKRMNASRAAFPNITLSSNIGSTIPRNAKSCGLEAPGTCQIGKNYWRKSKFILMTERNSGEKLLPEATKSNRRCCDILYKRMIFPSCFQKFGSRGGILCALDSSEA